MIYKFTVISINYQIKITYGALSILYPLVLSMMVFLSWESAAVHRTAMVIANSHMFTPSFMWPIITYFVHVTNIKYRFR